MNAKYLVVTGAPADPRVNTVCPVLDAREMDKAQFVDEFGLNKWETELIQFFDNATPGSRTLARGGCLLILRLS